MSAEQKRQLALEINTLDPSWLALLKDEIVKPEFIALKKFIEADVRSGQNVFPPSEDVYSWYVHLFLLVFVVGPVLSEFLSCVFYSTLCCMNKC